MSSGSDAPAATASSLAQVQSSCRTGQDANTKEDCRIVAVVNSVQDFWAQEFARRNGTYTRSPTVFFSGQGRHRLRDGDLGGGAVLLSR